MQQTAQKIRPIEVTIITLWALVTSLCYLPSGIYVVYKIAISDYNLNLPYVQGMQMIFWPMGSFPAFVAYIGIPISIAWIIGSVYFLKGRRVGYNLVGILLIVATASNVTILGNVPALIFLLVIDVGLLAFILKSRHIKEYFCS